MTWLLDPFQSEFSQRAGLICLMIGVLAPVVGTWVSLRRLAYMGDAMSHSVLGGVALGFAWLGTSAVLPGALVAGVAMALLIHWLSQNRRVATDSVIAVVGTGLFALGVLLITRIDSPVSLTHFLFGQLLSVGTSDLWITLALTVVCLAFAWWAHGDLVWSTFDRDHAVQVGIPVRRLDAAVLVVLALCVVVCLSAVGTILTVSLLITPAATARLFHDRIGPLMATGVGLGLVEVLGGFVVAYHADLPPGPTIALGATLVFVACYAARLGRSERTWVRHVHSHDGHAH